MSAGDLIYSVAGVSCEHCCTSIENEVGAVAGVESVEVDLERGVVTVRGRDVNDDAVRAAIDEAGYEVAAIAR